MTRPPILRHRRTLHLGGVEDGLDDVVVAGAAAQVAFEPVAHLFFGRARVVREQSRGGHDHAWRAVAALEAVIVPEGLLQRMQLVLGGEPLDRSQRRAVGLHCEHRARLHGQAVHVDRASSAVGRVAANVRPGQPEVIAYRMDQQQARLHLQVVLDAVDVQADGNGSTHASPFQVCWARRDHTPTTMPL